MAASRSVPARQRSLRDHNLALALRLVADAAQPVSRAQIAATTGLTRATASALVEDLLAAGLVEEVAPLAAARSGRPATGLRLAAGGPGGLGLEVNVDYVAVTVVDLAGAVVHHQVRAGDQRQASPAEVLRAAGQLAADAVAAAAAVGVPVAGLEVALPGLVRDGRLLLAPNLGWQDVDVLALLRRTRRLAALPMTASNEADLAARGEVTADLRSFVHVSGEIGIGAGIVVDGELYGGSHGWAGELGHVTVDAGGPPCRCGARGCLEVYAGQEAVLRAAGLPSGGTALGGQGAALVEAAERGDRAALTALDAAAHALGTALSGVLNLLDLPVVVLGGTYALLAPWLSPAVEQELARRVLWSSYDRPQVRAAAHGPEAAVLGAARSVSARVLTAPERWFVT
jgi:predicted NBD/HSP70 family sugar kinase